MNIWSIFGSVEVDGSQAVTELGNVQDQARRTGDSLERDVVQKANSTSEQLRDLGGGLRQLGIGLSAAITAPIAALAGAGVKSAAELEVFSNSLNVMIGDAEKAQALFDELYEFSASTPFSWQALTEATRQLVAFGVESDAVIPLMSQLGDVAAGLDTPIEDLAQIFGRVLVNGKMSMEEVNRLAERGVPIYSELAEVLGVAESEIRDMVSSGDINITHLQQVFANLTEEGGKFGGMMEALATTTIGKWATLKDTFSVVTDLVGERLLPVVNQVLDWAASAVDWFVELDEDLQNNIITITGIVAAIGPLLAVGGQLITMLSGNAGLTAVFGLLKGAMAFLTGPTGILLVIAGLITNEVVQSMGGWQVVIESLLGWIQKLWQDAQPALEALRDVFASVFAVIQDLWESGLKPTLEAVAPLVQSVFSSVGTIIEGALAFITGLLQALAALLRGDFMGAWQAVTDGVIGLVQKLWDAVSSLFGDLVVMFTGFGRDAVDGFINGLTNTFSKAKDAVTGFGNNILGWFKNTLGIQSPSTIFAAFGVDTVEGFIGGLQATFSKAKNAVTNFGGNIMGWFRDTLGIQSPSVVFYGYGQNIAQGLADGITSGAPLVEAATRGLGKAALTGLSIGLVPVTSPGDAGGSGSNEMSDALKAELEARRELVAELTTMSADKGPLANLGAAMMDLVSSKVPLFGAALEGFVQAGPIGALISIFTELLGRSEAFNHIMGMLNSILDPIVSALDVLFTALMPIIEVAVRLVEVALLPLTWVIESVLAPVITFVGGIIVGVYNAIASAVNWALGWLGVNMKKIPWPPSASSAPDPNPGGGGGSDPPGVVVRPIAPAPAPYKPPPPPEPYKPTPTERREEARVVSEAFGSTAQTLQLAVATPLVEASRMFAMAAEGIANVFGGVAGSQGASGMLPFSEAITNLTPVLERLLSEGVSISVNAGGGGAPNRDRGTAYLRTGSII